MSFPNTFIVGAAKAGTTSLHHYLGQHPQVFMSAWKEPHHFADITIDPNKSHMMRRYADERAYQALFAKAGDRPVVGEASPSYLWDPQAAARIRARVPHARIIVLLRDPVQRAFSHYWMDVREGLQTQAPLKAFRDDYALPGKRWGGKGHLYVELGFYARQLARFYEAFPAPQIRVYLFDELRSRPQAVLVDLATFLGIDPAPMSAIDTSEPLNPYARPRNALAGGLMRQAWLRQAAQHMIPARLRRSVRDHLLLRRDAKPPADREAIAWLSALYAPELDALERLLGRALPALRTSLVG
ncbi:sulfotransferase family protein [Sinimarinibacterium thermocellulolyticum]|uniref:Sulfotransferase n=1 Tax=Sinimarinibacterium thermocellulolyticum TaxID=3170016 RepID=A0ABV2A9L4_9GAMM